ncbi:MAG: DUF4249 domain-containing protein [Muribaculaceae bacterium]|nr:DUF4249 domain-containing protein [Muribaculaceae bacterium]
MSKLNRFYILAISLLTMLTSCEKEIDFSGQYDSGLAVYAIAVPGDAFSMRISRSFTVNDNPTVVFSLHSGYYSQLDTLYQAQIVIKNARVEVTVNGVDKYSMHYNPESPYPYTCDYIPKAGDKISVHVSAEGYNDVSASATIEQPQKIEILKTEVVYKDLGDDQADVVVNPLSGATDKFGEDSVMTLTLKMTDPAGERNYYRLRVCGVAERTRFYSSDFTSQFYALCDVYTSDDIIFTDNMLTKPYGQWAEGFSNVFDDHLFNGHDYTFTVESRKPRGENQHVIVELQTISQDLYYFLKSYMQFRISTDDVYMTPIGLYSNIRDGWGILGTLSYDRHIIYY